jgi:hypothetical protein
MAVALLMIKDFHAWEPLGFCFIADRTPLITNQVHSGRKVQLDSGCRRWLERTRAYAETSPIG